MKEDLFAHTNIFANIDVTPTKWMWTQN